MAVGSQTAALQRHLDLASQAERSQALRRQGRSLASHRPAEATRAVQEAKAIAEEHGNTAFMEKANCDLWVADIRQNRTSIHQHTQWRKMQQGLDDYEKC